MLMKFAVKNFLSFKDEVVLDLVAENQVSEMKDTNRIRTDRTHLLTGSVVYGTNGAGKSNLFSAFLFMKHFTHSSSRESQKGDPIRVTPFRLSVESMKHPSMFEAVFLLDGVRYRYGFEADAHRVHSEWLYMARKEKEYELFLREGDTIEISSKRFAEGGGLEQKTRENALFLSVVAQFNGEIAGEIVQWFGGGVNVISGLHDKHFESFTADMLDDSKAKQRVLQLLNQADIGIEDIQRTEVDLDDLDLKLPAQIGQFVKGRSAYSLKTFRTLYDEKGAAAGMTEFDFESSESEGTKKYFRLAGPLLDTLEHGKVLFIDELDARLHPILTLNLLRLFNSPEINTKGAQLVFATHDSNILGSGLLRRDQVCLMEKNKLSASDLYKLSDFKVRKDASFEPNYLKGRYGAIPFLGSLSDLTRHVHQEKMSHG